MKKKKRQHKLERETQRHQPTAMYRIYLVLIQINYVKKKNNTHTKTTMI